MSVQEQARLELKPLADPPAATDPAEKVSCKACGYTNAAQAVVCGLCGELLVEKVVTTNDEPRDEAPTPRPELLQDKHQERLEQEASARRRRTRELRGYAITGALTFSVLSGLLSLIGGVGHLGWERTLIVGFIVGLPIGYLVGRLGGGPVKGAVISSLAFAGLEVTLVTPGLMDGSLHGSDLLVAVLSGVAVGIVPGAIIGWHVEMNR
ncbi:MAG: hypothetical protein AB1486_12195 [Planctomycetota bacterium]